MKIGCLLAILILVCAIVLTVRQQIHKDKYDADIKLRCQKIIDNLAGPDRILTNEEVLGLLKYLGSKEYLQDGDGITMQSHWAGGDMHMDGLVDVYVGGKVMHNKFGYHFIPSRKIGTYTIEELEKYSK